MGATNPLAKWSVVILKALCGLLALPQVCNMKMESALTSDRKASEHLVHGILLLTETSVIS